MGNSGSALKRNRKTLKIYAGLTVFSEDEILRFYDEFKRIGSLDDQEVYFINYGNINKA